MNRTWAGKKLNTIERRIAVLEYQRHELGKRVFVSGEPAEAEQRARYFAISDVRLRRKLIGIERRLHEARRRRHTALVTYWRSTVAETRGKLDDLRSDSPGSDWRRGILWDVLTVFWILAGFGWLTLQWIGLGVGAAAAAVWSRRLVRSRAGARITFLRQGDDALRAHESELRKAEREAAAAESELPLFSEQEEKTGIEDAPRAMATAE